MEEAKTLGLSGINGFMVLSIAKDSKAKTMQIKPNDVLLAINGIDITSIAQLQDLMFRGSIMSVKIFRAGAISTLQAPLVF